MALSGKLLKMERKGVTRSYGRPDQSETSTQSVSVIEGLRNKKLSIEVVSIEGLKHQNFIR